MQVRERPTTNHRTSPPRPSRVPCPHVSPPRWLEPYLHSLASIIEPIISLQSQDHNPISSLPSPFPKSRASSSPVRRNGGEQAQGGQAPGADERPPRHRRWQGDHREGRLRLPASHLAQEDGRRRGDLRRGPQEGRRLHRAVRGEA